MKVVAVIPIVALVRALEAKTTRYANNKEMMAARRKA
jgi:hypothetical protein